MRHYVTRFDDTELAVPTGYEEHSTGYRRAAHIDAAIGATHTAIGTCALEAGGSIAAHVHSYEEFFYVLRGSPCITINGDMWELAPDECGFVGVGTAHSWTNSNTGDSLWVEFVTPQPRGANLPPDTFFVDAPNPALPRPIDIRDPRTRMFARWRHTHMDLEALTRPWPVSAPEVSASMSSALLAYSGITVKMLLDERHGAALGNVFMVDYYPRVVLHPHDHPLEEAFYMLEGEVVYTADGREYTLRPGDVAYAGVGSIHAFENRTDERCRWLETRAPNPPLQHAYRFERDWEYLAERAVAAR